MKMKNSICASQRRVLTAFNRTLRQRLDTQNTSFRRPAVQQRRCFRSTRSRPEETRSFRGQLYESTAQRLARERADEAKYIENRQRMGPSKALQTFALTIRESDLSTAIGVKV